MSGPNFDEHSIKHVSVYCSECSWYRRVGAEGDDVRAFPTWLVRVLYRLMLLRGAIHGAARHPDRSVGE